MKYAIIISSFAPLIVMLNLAIMSIQPTLKRKIIVACLFMCLPSPLFAYLNYIERQELPPFVLWLAVVLSVVPLLGAIRTYQSGCYWQKKIEQMKQRRVKHAAYMESLRFKEDEEPA